jgi:hypothetical protein
LIDLLSIENIKSIKYCILIWILNIQYWSIIWILDHLNVESWILNIDRSIEYWKLIDQLNIEYWILINLNQSISIWISIPNWNRSHPEYLSQSEYQIEAIWIWIFDARTIILIKLFTSKLNKFSNQNKILIQFKGLWNV